MGGKLFSLGHKYQRLDEEETVESFRMHDFSLRSYLEDYFPEEDFQLATNFAYSESKPFEWKTFVPYRLKLDECALFPEFYFHFKRSFSAISNENRAYCSVNLERFKSSYVGNEQDVMSSMVRVEQDFDYKFRQCLDPELLKDFSTWTFTRGCIETKFLLTLEKQVDFVAYPRRLDELSYRAKAGEVEPLVDFLMAYKYPESSIWQHIFLLYSGHFDKPKGAEIFNAAAEKWQGEEIPLLRQIEGFVKDLKDAGHRALPEAGAWVFITLPLFILFVVFFTLFLVKK